MDEAINKAVEWFKENQRMYVNFSQQLLTVIRAILDSEGIQYHNITSRVKEIDSFAEKCVRKEYIDPVNQNTDFCGIRIIAYTNSDVNKICYLLEKEFDIDYENSNNKSLLLDIDRVGYRSIHYVVKYDNNRLKLSEYKLYINLKCEVQVRTILEHAWAEIEHDRIYKSNKPIPGNLKRQFNLISGDLEGIDNRFDSIIKEIDLANKNEQQFSENRISAETLKEFLLTRFPFAREWEVNNTELIKSLYLDLYEYGFKTIGDIEKCMLKDFEKWAARELRSPVDIIWSIMILDNPERFFSLIANTNPRQSITFSKIENPFLYFGLDLEECFKKHKFLMIRDLGF